MISHPEPLSFHPCLGQWEAEDRAFRAKRTDGFAASTLGDMPDCCGIGFTLSCSPDTHACGILLRADPGLEGYYQLRWEPGRRRVVYDRWPRPGDEPFMLERPVETTPGEPLKLKVFIDGTVVVSYVNDAVALSSRAYDRRTGQIGLFVDGGEATFSDVTMRS